MRQNVDLGSPDSSYEVVTNRMYSPRHTSHKCRTIPRPARRVDAAGGPHGCYGSATPGQAQENQHLVKFTYIDTTLHKCRTTTAPTKHRPLVPGVEETAKEDVTASLLRCMPSNPFAIYHHPLCTNPPRVDRIRYLCGGGTRRVGPRPKLRPGRVNTAQYPSEYSDQDTTSAPGMSASEDHLRTDSVRAVFRSSSGTPSPREESNSRSSESARKPE
jgi:hypothetical protein